ncbi:hypothetical protein RRF57_008755 [Xylaria bambusicola]|uniref:Uncharacterized protein n=1 Tax=Xylaria bambusicola TaxID=326684 RepID=A0AAN7UVU7_9PEZI
MISIYGRIDVRCRVAIVSRHGLGVKSNADSVIPCWNILYFEDKAVTATFTSSLKAGCHNAYCLKQRHLNHDEDHAAIFRKQMELRSKTISSSTGLRPLPEPSFFFSPPIALSRKMGVSLLMPYP